MNLEGSIRNKRGRDLISNNANDTNEEFKNDRDRRAFNEM